MSLWRSRRREEGREGRKGEREKSSEEMKVNRCEQPPVLVCSAVTHSSHSTDNSHQHQTNSMPAHVSVPTVNMHSGNTESTPHTPEGRVDLLLG